MKCKCGNMMMQSSMQQWSWFCVATAMSTDHPESVISSCGRIMFGKWMKDGELE
jgi:hypothetical protein